MIKKIVLTFVLSFSIFSTFIRISEVNAAASAGATSAAATAAMRGVSINRNKDNDTLEKHDTEYQDETDNPNKAQETINNLMGYNEADELEELFSKELNKMNESEIDELEKILGEKKLLTEDEEVLKELIKINDSKSTETPVVVRMLFPIIVVIFMALLM